jgi:hypothetical protein
MTNELPIHQIEDEEPYAMVRSQHCLAGGGLA